MEYGKQERIDKASPRRNHKKECRMEGGRSKDMASKEKITMGRIESANQER